MYRSRRISNFIYSSEREYEALFSSCAREFDQTQVSPSFEVRKNIFASQIAYRFSLQLITRSCLRICSCKKAIFENTPDFGVRVQIYIYRSRRNPTLCYSSKRDGASIEPRITLKIRIAKHQTTTLKLLLGRSKLWPLCI